MAGDNISIRDKKKAFKCAKHNFDPAAAMISVTFYLLLMKNKGEKSLLEPWSLNWDPLSLNLAE